MRKEEEISENKFLLLQAIVYIDEGNLEKLKALVASENKGREQKISYEALAQRLLAKGF